MDEIIPGLWIGDLPSALDVKTLKSKKIFSILSAMRGKISIHETFIKHQILLDDTEEADILQHFIPSITFIQEELDKERGVLVHCQAGLSRSTTIVAAYLMYSRNATPEEALQLIRKSRPSVDPNPGFLAQLKLFHDASFKISGGDKNTRMFYLQKTVEGVLHGDGSVPSTVMFAKVPETPSASTTIPTPGTKTGSRRRIRCKMCRRELATREHMLDHGQLGPATPPASRRPSTSHRPGTHPLSRNPSISMTPVSPTTDKQIQPLSKTPSTSTSKSEIGCPSESGESRPRRESVSGQGTSVATTDGQKPSTSALELSDEEGERRDEAAQRQLRAADAGRRMSGAMITPSSGVADKNQQPTEASSTSKQLDSPYFANANDLAAQLYSNPKLAGLRSSVTTPGGSTPSSGPGTKAISPPILMNPKCSGYFVEPMKWMEPFLEEGHTAGKIVCPNKKCGAKLGNYDWAGVCCGCKEWVIPGFCINRSKVDEVVV